MFGQNTWRNLVNLADELEHWVIGQVLLGEGSLGHITGVGLPENGMAISRDDLAGLESGPQVVGNGLVAEIIANGSFHLSEPVQYFLVGKAVERTSETIETSSKREHRRAEGASYQVSGVGTDVAALVVSVDGEVQSHQLNEVLVLTKAKLIGKVETVVLVLLDRSDLSAFEDILVDSCGDGGELGNQVHRVLKSVAPVFGFPHAFGVRLGKGRFVLESSDCEGELCHGVEVARASVDQLLNKFGNVRTGGPFCGKIADLLLGGDFARQQQPEET